jgi:tetratricopeptide (TPR) repeat protein
MLGASVKREEGHYDEALGYNKMLLEQNGESASGLASEARTLLRMKKDAKALDAALQAHRMDEKNSYAEASLILAYHFNGKKDQRDALIRQATKDATEPTDKRAVQYALDVIAKKEKFRD